MKGKLLLASLALTGTLIFSGAAFAQQQGAGGAQGMQWTQETAQGSGAPLTIAPSTVRQIQLRLNQAGFDPGDVDGTWGQGTSSALANFQRTVGLEPTGQINLNTLGALGINISSQYGVAPQFGGQMGGGYGGQFQQPNQQGFQQPNQQGFQQPQFRGQQFQRGAAPGMR